MHSNYILSPKLKEKIMAVPTHSEFGTEHAAMLNGTEYEDVLKWFHSDLANNTLKYDASIVNRINSLLTGDNGLPAWGIGVDKVIQPGLFDNLGIPNNNGEFCSSKKVDAHLNDIALATAYFLGDVNNSILMHPKKRIPLNFRDYGFGSELEFIMSMSAYGISEVRSSTGSHKSEEWLSKSGYKIEISSCDDHDPIIRFRDQKVQKNISPLGIFVDFKPEAVDGGFQFSQQTEPEILGSLFSFVASQIDMEEVFGRDGEKLRSLFGYKANESLLNKESLRIFMNNATNPLQKIGDNSEPNIRHRLDRGIFLVNENNELEFRRCNGRDISENVIFLLSLEDAIELIKNIFLLINKQNTFRTMPRTGYNFVTKYFHKLCK